MTRQKTFKRSVRARAQKTGERYSAARHQLLRTPASEPPAVSRAADQPSPAGQTGPGADAPAELDVSETRLREATGRSWAEWLDLLDAWGATSQRHPQIARWLAQEHGVEPWWSQNITVAYERARGMRARHQVARGFSVGATKMIGVDAQRAFDAFTDTAQRQRWLAGMELRPRTSIRPRSARFDWPPDGSRVVVDITARGDDKVQVAVQHEKLPDAESAERMKAFWRERLAGLKQLLEG
ncbi:MAG TPA: SRPBCC domain-containing protein [Candidatus Limnocylindria bacterium]|nr:SRPBCC domain-containing protein [Candidatus Limnocylindria bacterium]